MSPLHSPRLSLAWLSLTFRLFSHPLPTHSNTSTDGHSIFLPPSSLRDCSLPHYSLSTSEITLVHGGVEGHEAIESLEYPSPSGLSWSPSRVPTTSRAHPRLTSLPRLTLHHSLHLPTTLLTLPSSMHPLTISLSASELNLPVQPVQGKEDR